MQTLYFFLFYLVSLPSNGQHAILYEGGNVFATQWTALKTTAQTPVGTGGKVIYNGSSNSYIISWIQKDGSELSMKFTYVGNLEDLRLFQAGSGQQYAVDTSNLHTKGIFFALLVDLNSKTVRNEGVLITGLKRK